MTAMAARSHHYCADCCLYFDSEMSLQVHLQYHKENLLSLWSPQNKTSHKGDMMTECKRTGDKLSDLAADPKDDLTNSSTSQISKQYYIPSYTPSSTYYNVPHHPSSDKMKDRLAQGFESNFDSPPNPSFSSPGFPSFDQNHPSNGDSSVLTPGRLGNAGAPLLNGRTDGEAAALSDSVHTSYLSDMKSDAERSAFGGYVKRSERKSPGPTDRPLMSPDSGKRNMLAKYNGGESGAPGPYSEAGESACGVPSSDSGIGDTEGQTEETSEILDLDTNRLHVYQGPIPNEGPDFTSGVNYNPWGYPTPPVSVQSAISPQQAGSPRPQPHFLELGGRPKDEGFSSYGMHPYYGEPMYYGGEGMRQPNMGSMERLARDPESCIPSPKMMRPDHGSYPFGAKPLDERIPPQWNPTMHQPFNPDFPSNSGPPPLMRSAPASSPQVSRFNSPPLPPQRDPSSPGNEAKDEKKPRPFTCEVCNKHFIRKGHLNRHLTTTAHKNAENQRANGQPPIVEKSSSGSRPKVSSEGSQSRMNGVWRGDGPPGSAPDNGPHSPSLSINQAISPSSQVNRQDNDSSTNSMSHPLNFPSYPPQSFIPTRPGLPPPYPPTSQPVYPIDPYYSGNLPPNVRSPVPSSQPSVGNSSIRGFVPPQGARLPPAPFYPSQLSPGGQFPSPGAPSRYSATPSSRYSPVHSIPGKPSSAVPQELSPFGPPFSPNQQRSNYSIREDSMYTQEHFARDDVYLTATDSGNIRTQVPDFSQANPPPTYPGSGSSVTSVR